MRFALAFSVVVAAVAPALGQSDISTPKIITAAVGNCTVTVGGTDVGCEGKAIETVLANGHHLFNFLPKDLNGVGFAGTDVQRIDPKRPILAIEHVYLSNNRYDADGSCLYETDSGDDQTFHKVECKALLRDGRKVTAMLDGESDPGAPPPENDDAPPGVSKVAQ